MKKLLYTFLLLFTMSTVFTGCREEKSTGEKVEDAVDDAGDAVEDAADDVGDAIDDATD
jgi:predicted small secreted protein